MKKAIVYICLTAVLCLSLVFAGCKEGGRKEEPGDCTHQWGDWVVTERSTCEKQGRQKRECSICGFTEEGETPLHNLRYNDARPVTCVRKGWDAYVSCKDCDYTTYSEKAPLDHNYENNFCVNCGRTALAMGIIRGEAVAFGIGCYEGEHLKIPAQHQGYAVTQVGLNAFPHVDGLKSVTLPNTIKKFDLYAFEYCSDLEMAVLPESLKGKQWGSFTNCINLKDITYVPDGQLEGFTPMEDTETDEDTLLDIEIINNKAVVKGLGSFEGENIVIPETYNGRDVEVIAAGAFKNCSHIRSVVMPYRTSRIESMAFAGCSKLTEVIFDTANSETKVTLAHNAFEGCSNIHLEIPWNVSDDLTCFNEAVVTATIHSGINGWTSIYSSVKRAADDTDSQSAVVPCVKYFKNLKKLIIGDDVTGIWDYAFNDCDNFEELVISGNVMKMGLDCFKDCRYLKKVTLKKGVSAISVSAFTGCIRLRQCIVEQPEGWTTDEQISNPSIAARWLQSNTLKRRPYYGK